MIEPNNLSCESGIYRILNTINGKVWVGQAKGKGGIRARLKGHIQLFKRGKNSPYLQKAWDKHGPEAFISEVIVLCPREQCDTLENYYLDLFQSFERNQGYNIERKASGKGCVPEETRKKISESSKGKLISDVSRARSSASHKGQSKPHTEQSKAKLSKSMLGNSNGTALTLEGRLERSRFVSTLKWIHHLEKGCKRVREGELGVYFSEGWELGRK